MLQPLQLEWSRKIQAIAQNGLTFARDPFDVERYEQLRAIAAEMAADVSGQDLELVRGAFQVEAGYATPKIDVRGVVFCEERILLVKERQDGLWTLPGGWADVGESPREAVVKEIREESGYLACPVKLLAVLDRNKHEHPYLIYHVYKMFILCEIIGGEPAESLETEGVGFFAEEELPPLSLTRVLPAQIARLFEHHRHPEWPTDFD